jgi:hypothetical protein
MSALIFALGVSFGGLAGGGVCIHLFRQQVMGEFGTRLHQVQRQLNSLETAIHVAIMTQYDEISRRPPPNPPLRPPDNSGKQS